MLSLMGRLQERDILSQELKDLAQECYETVPRKETISCIFFNLVDNIQEYNTRGI